MAKRQPQPRDKGCLVKPNFIRFPHIILFPLINLFNRDIVKNLGTRTESIKHLIPHGYREIFY